MAIYKIQHINTGAEDWIDILALLQAAQDNRINYQDKTIVINDNYYTLTNFKTINPMAYDPNAQSGNANIQDWQPNQQVSAGDERIYNGRLYTAQSAHTTSVSFQTDLTAGIWQDLSQVKQEVTRVTGTTNLTLNHEMVVVDTSGVVTPIVINLPVAAPIGYKVEVARVGTGISSVTVTTPVNEVLADGGSTKVLNSQAIFGFSKISATEWKLV